MFSGNVSLNSVTIGSGVKEIKEYAFYGSRALQSLTIPSNVTKIGDYAFSNSGLTSVVIPSTVTTFGYGTFSYNKSLKKVEINSTTVGDSMFSYCSALTTVTFGKTTTIGNSSFIYTTALQSITIPSTVTKIGNSAFSNSGLTSIKIPYTVTSMGSSVFYNNKKLTTVSYNSKTLSNSMFDGASALKTVTIGSNVKTIEGWAFANTGLTSITIPSNVTKMYGSLFYGCKSLKTITLQTNSFQEDRYNSSFEGINSTYTIKLGSNIKEIKDSAFYGLSNLTSVTIPSSVTSIGSYAFSNTGLTSITIPNTVTTIGSNIFSGDKKLKTVTINSNVLSPYMFSGCDALTSVILGSNITEIPSYAFSGSTLSTITLPSNVTTLKEYSFYKSGLTSITIPETIENIEGSVFKNSIKLKSATLKNNTMGESMFSECTALTSLKLSENIRTIPSYAIENTAITSFTIPNTITTLDSYAFANSNLTSIVIPATIQDPGYATFSSSKKLKSVTINNSEMANYMFSGCNALTTVKLNNNITRISSGAFSSTGITKFTIPNTIERIDSYAFSDSQLSEIIIPSSVLRIESEAFANTQLSTITIPSTVKYVDSRILENAKKLKTINYQAKEIPSYMCSNCQSLTTVTLGNNVEVIDSGAFSGSGLKTINIPSSVRTIYYWAFTNCPNLSSIYIPSGVTLYDYYGAWEIFDKRTTLLVDENSPIISYAQTNKLQYQVVAKIKNTTISKVADQQYTGSAITPSVVITDGGKTLVEGVDYTLSYKNNTNVGTATVTITGIGSYYGNINKTFKIVA